jgi:hypothetical protein
MGGLLLLGILLAAWKYLVAAFVLWLVIWWLLRVAQTERTTRLAERRRRQGIHQAIDNVTAATLREMLDAANEDRLT